VTITATVSEIEYAGDGVSTVFSVPFVFDTSADLKVVRTDTDGNAVELSTGYSVSGGGGSTGSVTLSTALASGYTLTISDDPDLTQPVDYVANDDFPAESHEDALDRGVRISKRILQIVKRALRTTDGDPSGESEMTLPSVQARKGKVLGFNATTGAPEMVASVTSVGSLSASIIGGFLYAQTTAESAAGVTPTLYQYPPGDVRRYGAVGDGTTNCTTAIQSAINVAIAGDRRVYLTPAASEYLITSPLTITASVSILGAGQRASRILCSGCDAFTISAGVASVKLDSFRIAQAVRHTTTPNTYVAVDVLGTTASPCDWHEYNKLLIDGFETPFSAAGVHQSQWDNCVTAFCKHGIIAEQLTVNNRVNSCLFSGSGANSYGIKIGDNSSAAEGWTIEGGTLLYGFARGIWGSGASNCFVNNSYIDFFTEFGILLNGTSAASANWTITNNYIAGTGAADTGVYLTNASAPSLQRGNKVIGNQIFAYSGQTLTNGILIDGSQEGYNLIEGNSVDADTYDCRVTAGSTHTIVDNIWRGAGYSSSVRAIYRNNSGTFLPDPSAAISYDPYAHIAKALTYGATIATDVSEGDLFTITVTNNVAFTISAPTNPVTSKRIVYTIRNTSGGAMGAITWNGAFKLGAFTNPGNGNSRSIEFAYNGTNWIEISRASVDVPN